MTTSTLLRAALATAAFTGCTDTLPDTADGLQYVIELDDGSTLELWEQDGLRSLSGTNPVGVAPLDARYDLTRTPAEIFEQLRPGEPVPAELAALAWPARASSLQRSRRAEPALALTANAFRNKYCTTAVITHQVVPFEPKRHVTDCQVSWQGGRWSHLFQKQEVYGAVNPTVGTVTFRRSSKYSNVQNYTVTDWAVPVGQERWATAWTEAEPAVDAKYEVLDAAGDTFHVATVYADRAVCSTQHLCDVNGFGWIHSSCDDGRESFTPSGVCSF